MKVSRGPACVCPAGVARRFSLPLELPGSNPAEMDGKVFDVVVVGAGLVGSSAAFHATQLPNISVCLVGPTEPKNRQEEELFGCWHDEGRLFYRIVSHPTWQVLAKRSIERYAGLEELTGIKIYTEAGFLQVHKERKKLEENLELNHKQGLGGQDLTHTWKSVFPFLNLPEGASVCYEEKNAGYLSPRRQVEAHQKAAQSSGAHILQEVVHTVSPSKDTSHRWEVVTETGSLLQCQHVLVAAGGYAALKPLFEHVKPGMVPKLELRTQTVAYLRIGEDEACRLRKMPGIVINHPFQKLDGAYILPPIKYPDGKWYLKLGHGRMYEEKRSTLAEVIQWYRQQSGIPECVEELACYLKHLLPGLKVENIHGDGCLTSHTPGFEPYIDTVAQGFGVALGGNGYGGKASEEFGRLAAHSLLLGQWNSDIPRENVRVIWETESKPKEH